MIREFIKNNCDANAPFLRASQDGTCVLRTDDMLILKFARLLDIVGKQDIYDFLLVGGSTRMLQVQDMVKAHFAHCVDIIHGPYEVDEAVAKGVALFAATRNFCNEIDDSPYSLSGVVMPGDIALPPDINETPREFADLEII